MSLSPRERDILERIENRLRDEDPEFETRLARARRRQRTTDLWWISLVSALSILTGVGLMVLAALFENSIVMVAGLGTALTAPIVVTVWRYLRRNP